MKKFILLFITVTFSYVIMAQAPGSFPANRPANMKAPTIGHVYGKITDAAGKPVGGVSVLVMQNRFDTVTKKMKEILIKGTATANNGDFSVDELPIFGALNLRISASGYAMIQQPISFITKKPGDAPGKPAGAPGGMPGQGMMGQSFDKDLGKIKLTTDVKQLEGVTVVSNKPMVKMDGEKKVFNVEKNIVSAGGTAVDVMRNVPSVNVDIDGNVALRNSPPQIFVDGRPTTLSLDQIPADAIESVEVITNPSAKYDASGGGAGILNIVLKKNRKSGYNGNLRAGIDKRGAVNGGGDINVRQGKLNISASVMGNQNKGRTSGTTQRLNLLDVPQTSVFQNNYNRTNGGFIFGKLGLDYFVTNRTTLSVAGIRVHGQFEPRETININTDSLYNTGKISNFSDRTSTGKRVFNAYGAVLGMKHLFPKEGEEWTIDANIFSGKNENNSLYATNYYNPNNTLAGIELQQVLGNGKNKFLTIQTDYVKPITPKTKLETGLRASIRSIKSNNDNYLFDDVANNYVIIPSATSNYTNKDNVYAGYVTLSSSIKDFTYQAGLRAESSNYNGDLTNTGEKFSNKYPVSLFPSLFLTQKFTGNQQLQLSYSRRINRPNFFQIIPFTDYTDKLNITRGNPGLVPEFTQSFELSYLKTFKGNNTFLASAYYKRTNDLITRYLDKQSDAVTGEDILINTYINANSSYTAGAEFTAQNYLKKWWDISTNLNVYQSKINTDNVTGSSQGALVAFFGKFNSNFKLPAKFSMQLSAIYQSKTNLPVNSGGGGFGGGPGGGFGQSQSSSQGYIRAFWGTDIAVKKSFLKNDAASISLSVNDIFRTRKTEQYSESAYFTQNYYRIRDPQMFRLNFNYRFGKMDMSLFKRKVNSNTSGATEGMQ